MKWTSKTSLHNISEPLLPFPYVNCTSPGINTVCFFSFGIFYDDITQKVLKIIEFGKKFLKDIGNAFCDV